MSESRAIALENLSFAYDGLPALYDINMSVPRGQFVALAGANGAGKTTLIKHLVGLLRPTDGTIRIMGRDAASLTIGELAGEVGFVFQNPENQIFSATVREEIAFGPRNLGVDGGALDAQVEATIETFGLVEVRDHPPAVLSFSARRMVALASIAAMNAPILALDEPMVGLDGRGRRQVLDWLISQWRGGATVILVTHDMEAVAAHAERMVVLREGRIAADGPPGEVFRQAALLAESGLEKPFAVALGDSLNLSTGGDSFSIETLAQAWLAQRNPARDGRGGP